MVAVKSVRSLSVLLLSQTACVSSRPSVDTLMGFKPGRGSSVSRSWGRNEEDRSASRRGRRQAEGELRRQLERERSGTCGEGEGVFYRPTPLLTIAWPQLAEGGGAKMETASTTLRAAS